MMSADIHPKKGRKSLKSEERLTMVLGIMACAEVGASAISCWIENVSLMVFVSGEHMGGINTLINDVISSSTILTCEIRVMVEYNALCVITDFIELGFECRDFSPLFTCFEDMI
jgi:hypothetical protein